MSDHHDAHVMAFKAMARRARWRRLKEAQRSRNRTPQPELPPPAVVDRILQERDRRSRGFGAYPPNGGGAHNSGWGSHAFHCDVWAARAVLEQQLLGKRVSDGMIAAWMSANGLRHGYAESSLRTMIWRARKAISQLETAPRRSTGKPLWAPFPSTSDPE